MKNAHLQVKAGSLVKYPPKTGPRTAAAPAVAPHIPKATLRALPVKVVVRIDRVAGEAIAAPDPWTTRPRRALIRSWGHAWTIDPTTNREIHATNIRFLPKPSLNYPHVIR